MKYCLFITICTLFLTPTATYAEGLPANPWASKREIIDNTVFHASRDDLVRSEPVRQSNTDNNMQELQSIAASIKEKWQQSSKNEQSRQNSYVREQNNNNTDDNVDTIDAIKALDTLSRYMNRDNNTQSSTSSSPDFSALKQKFSNMTANNNNQSSALNSETQRKINKMKYEYNHYKSQLNSNYNTLKSKAKPMIDTMKKSVKEAERVSGVNF